MNSSITDRFVAELIDLGASRLPQAIVQQAKRCLLNYLGVTLAGAQLLREQGRHLLSLLDPSGDSNTVIGLGRRSSLQNAILINGMCAHAAELDDGTRFGNVHPGAPIISALLPLAEREGLSGSAVVAGIVTGYEAAIRVAAAIQPAHKEQGFHATGTCGTIGAAMGIAACLHFPHNMARSALAAASTAASGTLHVIRGQSQLKPFNAGKAALNGFLAATMARAGFDGPEEVLVGRHGFLPMMAEQFETGVLCAPERSGFAIQRVYFKPYAACRHCHAPIEAALAVRSSTRPRVDQISEIRVSTYRLALEGHDHTDITNVASAKMSIPFGVAVALAHGRAGIDAFTPALVADPMVRELARRVRIQADPQMSAAVPEKRPALVEVILHDQTRHEVQVDLPKGEPETPLSDDEIREQFAALAVFAGVAPHVADQIIYAVDNVETMLSRLYRLL